MPHPNPDFLPLPLTGAHVHLLPLSPDHLPGLQTAAQDGNLHTLWYTNIPSPAAMEAEITRRLALQQTGSMAPFTVQLPTGQIAGMTTYMNIDATNRRVEIGSTWYAKSHQRTPLNTEAKLLLLTHAFETLNVIAVEFRTHVLNHQSRKAIERLGAKQDGIIRNHLISPNGTLRDTAIYSILPQEWPTIKSHLTHKLTTHPFNATTSP